MRFVLRVLLVGLVVGSISAFFIFEHQVKKKSHTLSLPELAAYQHKVVAYWKKELERDPFNYIAAQKIAASNLKLTRLTGNENFARDAESLLIETQKKAPKTDSNTEYLLARAQMARHAFAPALETASRLLLSEPNNMRFVGLRADAAFQMGLYAQASKDLQELIGYNPDSSTYSRRAQAFVVRGHDPEALTSFEQALKRVEEGSGEDKAWILVQMAGIHFRLNELDAAEKLLKDALEATPEYHPAYFPLGEVYEARADYEHAREAYLKSINFKPEPKTLARLSQVEAASGHPDRAAELKAEAFQRASFWAQDGTDGHARDYAELLLCEKKELPRALEFVAKDLKLRPEDIRSLFVAAKANRLNGNLAKAKEYIDRTMQYGMQEPEFFVEAGKIAAGLGDAEKAKGLQAAAEKINPVLAKWAAEG